MSPFLSDEEWKEYIDLVNGFVNAKANRNYTESDRIRSELKRRQDNVSDDEFVNMVESGRYLWHPMFETMGVGGHRYERLIKR